MDDLAGLGLQFALHHKFSSSERRLVFLFTVDKERETRFPRCHRPWEDRLLAPRLLRLVFSLLAILASISLPLLLLVAPLPFPPDSLSLLCSPFVSAGRVSFSSFSVSLFLPPSPSAAAAIVPVLSASRHSGGDRRIKACQKPTTASLHSKTPLHNKSACRASTGSRRAALPQQ